jgi:hypothetical protein
VKHGDSLSCFAFNVNVRRCVKEKAHMTGIAVLPQSRLFLVTTEDGTVKICH